MKRNQQLSFHIKEFWSSLSKNPQTWGHGCDHFVGDTLNNFEIKFCRIYIYWCNAQKFLATKLKILLVNETKYFTCIHEVLHQKLMLPYMNICSLFALYNLFQHIENKTYHFYEQQFDWIADHSQKNSESFYPKFGDFLTTNLTSHSYTASFCISNSIWSSSLTSMMVSYKLIL